jgi:hypothetical protein
MEFRSTNRMRGWAGATLALFASVFGGVGVLVGTFMSPESRYSWPGVFHVVFIFAGLGIGGVAAYGAIKNASFYTIVDRTAIEWGRSDGLKAIGKVEIAVLEKVIYTEGMDAGFDLVLIEKSGKGHKLGGEYLYSDSEAKRLMRFFLENHPGIQVIKK